MSKDNKHNLDPEALFKLLDKPGNTEELDEFEREALEGFAMLENKQAAVDSYNRVLANLSKKNSAAGERRQSPVRWLSIAAAFVILLSIGIVWQLNKQPSSEQIAMNATPPSELVIRPADESVAPDETPVTSSQNSAATGANVQGFSQDAARERALSKTLEPEKPRIQQDQLSDAEEQKPAEITLGYFADKDQSLSELQVVVKKADKNTADDEAKKTASDKAKYKGQSEYDPDKITTADNMPAANASPVVMNDEKTVETVTTKSAAGKKREESKQEKETASSPGIAAYSSANGAPMQTVALPVQSLILYYKGGEEALRAYILKQAKERNTAEVLKGTYLINAEIKADGSLHVTSLTNQAGDGKGQADFIKSIIDKSKGWLQPEKKGSSPSSIHFELTF